MSTVPSEISKYMGSATKLADIWGTLVYNVKAIPYLAKGDNSHVDTTNIQQSINDAALNGGVVVFPPGTYITGSFTVPTNVTLWFINGAKLSINSGATVAINGPIEAGQYQIFSGSGTVNGTPKVTTVSPCWFGAKDDGTDVSPAVNKAIHFLPSTGGIIQFPIGGFWSIQTQILVDRDDVSIIGQGHGAATTLVLSNHSFDVFRVTGNAFRLEKVKIINGGTSTNANVYAINCTGSNVRVEVVQFVDCFNGMFLETSNAYFRDIAMTGLKTGQGNGILIGPNSGEVLDFNSISIENATGQDARSGFSFQGGAGIQLNNCDLMKCGTCLLFEPSAHNVSSVNIQNSFLDSSSNAGIQFNPSGGFIAVKTRISNCWFACGSGIIVSGNGEGINITGCEFYNTNDGIRVGTGVPVRGLVITGNTFAGNASAAIGIGAGVSDFNITSNYFGPTNVYVGNGFGIYIDPGASNNYLITGNRIRGNINGQLVDNGTGANKLVTNNLI